MKIRARPAGARRKSRSELKSSPSRSPSVTHGYIKSFDGTKLFYSVEGQGTPLIFCYGLVCSSLHWTYQIDYFSRNYRAVWMDYRGHGNSEIPKDLGSLTVSNIARDLGTLLDELDIPQAAFLGHSMGVNIVLEFYRQQPERVAAMVLANGTATRPLETLFRSNLLVAGYALLKKLHGFKPELIQKIWKLQKSNPLTRSIVALGGFNPHLTPAEDIQLYVDQVVDMDPSIFIQLIGDYHRYDATPWLHTVKVPTLVIAGEQDKVTPVDSQELMHQLIPGSHFEVIRRGSHCPQMDLPELVNLKIERFLEEISYGSAPSPTKGNANRSIDRSAGPAP